VKTRKAPVTIPALSAIGAVAVVLGAWCGPAFASADVQAPGPELVSNTENSLHEILGDDEISSATIRTVDSPAKKKDESEKEDVTISESETPEIETRLPGVSVSDSSRFRRQMYRTDI